MSLKLKIEDIYKEAIKNKKTEEKNIVTTRNQTHKLEPSKNTQRLLFPLDLSLPLASLARSKTLPVLACPTGPCEPN